MLKINYSLFSLSFYIIETKKRKLGIFIFFNFRITYAKTGNDSMLIESFPVFMLNQIFNSSEYYMRLLHMFV